MFDAQYNPLIVATQSAKRLTRSPLAVAIVWAIFFSSLLFGGVVGIVVKMTANDTAFNIAIAQTISLVLTFGFVALMLWLWLRFYEGRSFATLGFQASRITAKIGLGALSGVLMIGASFALALLSGAYVVVDGESANFGMSALPAVIFVLVGWIVQGSTEEIVFRGWLLPVVSAGNNVRTGVVVSSGLFALLHLLNPGVTLLAVVNLTLFGVFSALYALREGSIWGVCAQHVVWNWLVGNVLGTAVSGGDSGFALFRFAQTDAHELLTGGAFGIEGSVIITAVLVVAIAALWFTGRSTVK